MTTEWREWDWPPRDRPRIEVLPPERQFVRVTIEQPRTNVVPLLFVALAVFVLSRFKLLGGLVMAAALLGLLPH
jgi:hypothetical protein